MGNLIRSQSNMAKTEPNELSPLTGKLSSITEECEHPSCVQKKESEQEQAANMNTLETQEEPSEQEGSRLWKTLRAGLGVTLVLVCTIFFALAGDFMKLSHAGGFSSFQIIFLNRTCIFAFNLILVAYVRPSLLGETRKQTGMLVAMGVGRNIATILLLFSIIYVSPGQAYSIIRGLGPVFTTIMALVFLKEAVAIVNLCGILVCIVGVVLVAVGMQEGESLSDEPPEIARSILLPLSAALSISAMMVLGRSLLRHTVHLFTLVFYIQGIGVIILLPLMLIFENPVWKLDSQTWAYAFAHAGSYGAAMFFLYAGLKLEKAGIVQTLENGVIPFSLLFDYVLLKKEPTYMEVGGGGLVLVGSIIVGTYTWWLNRQEERRKKLQNELNLGDKKSYTMGEEN
ncbi:PREDICTED: solute carrier family 35 member G1-like [Branchiostoma belcheri]|uniref:Solute carrier family 35 member G1-like n=1 Tax=Branchiostoma belcheri TaxID=7741 RepID=A0A6P5AI75_BRABE|nr:PREDICTED: solute carrier family 35 member G1-like [Branchiostoma belcheri]